MLMIEGGSDEWPVGINRRPAENLLLSWHSVTIMENCSFNCPMGDFRLFACSSNKNTINYVECVVCGQHSFKIQVSFTLLASCIGLPVT